MEKKDNRKYIRRDINIVNPSEQLLHLGMGLAPAYGTKKYGQNMGIPNSINSQNSCHKSWKNKKHSGLK